jgi:hypothetical protein
MSFGSKPNFPFPPKISPVVLKSFLANNKVIWELLNGQIGVLADTKRLDL